MKKGQTSSSNKDRGRRPQRPVHVNMDGWTRASTPPGVRSAMRGYTEDTTKVVSSAQPDNELQPAALSSPRKELQSSLSGVRGSASYADVVRKADRGSASVTAGPDEVQASTSTEQLTDHSTPEPLDLLPGSIKEMLQEGTSDLQGLELWAEEGKIPEFPDEVDEQLGLLPGSDGESFIVPPSISTVGHAQLDLARSFPDLMQYHSEERLAFYQLLGTQIQSSRNSSGGSFISSRLPTTFQDLPQYSTHERESIHMLLGAHVESIGNSSGGGSYSSTRTHFMLEGTRPDTSSPLGLPPPQGSTLPWSSQLLHVMDEMRRMRQLQQLQHHEMRQMRHDEMRHDEMRQMRQLHHDEMREMREMRQLQHDETREMRQLQQLQHDEMRHIRDEMRQMRDEMRQMRDEMRQIQDEMRQAHIH